MIFTPTRLKDAYVIDVERHGDERGFLARILRARIRGSRRTDAHLRAGSPTRNEWLGIELSARSERSAYVPEGFAQGYQTLEDDTEVLYQMSHHYVPAAARGVRWDDPVVRLESPAPDEAIIFQRDRSWPDQVQARLVD